MKLLKIALFLVAISCISSCSETQKQNNHKNENKVFECFQGIDTTKALATVGCVMSFHKIIDSNLVICINLKSVQLEYNKCMTIDIDSTNGNSMTELSIFKNGQANLTNICGDVIFEKNEPLRVVHALKGQIMVQFSDPTNLYGRIQPKASIFIKELIFIDPKTKKQIEIKNELLWKVLDLGMAG